MTENRKQTKFTSFERFVFIVIASLALALSLVAIHGVRVGLMPTVESPEKDRPRADFSYAAEKVTPSLVKVENIVLAGHPRTGKHGVAEVTRTREGTGFFIDKKGYILTNYHVVDGADALKVVTVARKSYDAEIIGGDAVTDIALIRIEPDFDVTPVVMGDSDEVKIGQWALALGNPLGLEFFTSAGIVSGFGPPGRGYIGVYDFIQIDVNIKPGNSGGPLVDYEGRVIGINTAYLGPGSGIGFSIPINRAKTIITALKESGGISRGFLGLLGQPIDEGLKTRLGLESESGALISAVMPDGPAEKAGVMAGDVVVGYDGLPVNDDRTLREAIFNTPAGSTVSLDIVRDGAPHTLTATLGDLTPRTVISERVVKQCGITLQELDEEMADKLGREGPGGLLVLKVIPGCPAAESGLRFGDILENIEGEKIFTIGDFYRRFSAIGAGSYALIGITRQGKPQYITIKQPKSE